MDATIEAQIMTTEQWESLANATRFVADSSRRYDIAIKSNGESEMRWAYKEYTHALDCYVSILTRL